MRTVAVLGAGNMGTALAQTIAANGHSARLWSIETDVLEEMRDRSLNSKYLPGVALHANVTPCWTIEEALAGAWLVLFSVPSHIVRGLARDAAPHIGREQAVLNAGKGLEEGTDKRMSEVLAEELPPHRGIAAMGGPAIATEFARGVPTAVIVGAAEGALSVEIQAAFQNEFFKVDTTDDVAGVELGASLKNAYAIALGMCDGLGYGANTKAFFASLALDEMAGLCRALGGRESTAYGLAGLGDLLTTGYSAHSRNRTLGEKLCTDPDWQEFVRTNTVEGIAACRAAKELAHRLDVSTPLLHAIYDVLFLDEPPAETMRLFLRDFAYG
jgi:glycerol-3-phosphate dehydrogenase (NAD(P)+)